MTRPGEVDYLLDELMQVPWNVYTKACLNYSATVVDYLGRYTHRIAISNQRVLGVDNGGVHFTAAGGPAEASGITEYGSGALPLSTVP